MLSRERLVLKRAAIPLALTVGLGLSACAGTEFPEGSSGALDEMNIIGSSKDGNINAVNTGEPVVVYSPETYQYIGSIASDEGFEIVCGDVKPNSFVIQFDGGQQGTVNLTNDLITDIATDTRVGIPRC